MERHFNIMETIQYKRRKYSQLKLYRIMPKYFIASYINNYSMIYFNECIYLFTVMFRIQPSSNAITTENKIGKKKKKFVFKFRTTLANQCKFQWRGVHRTRFLARQPCKFFLLRFVQIMGSSQSTLVADIKQASEQYFQFKVKVK